jgi:mRNA interferase HigB
MLAGERAMHIISKKRLVSAGERYAKILPALMRWFRVAGKARWNDIHETRADFPHADPVGKFTVFNIKNNEYRLITVIHYNRFKVYIRAVLTHVEYDKDKWKGD